MITHVKMLISGVSGAALALAMPVATASAQEVRPDLPAADEDTGDVDIIIVQARKRDERLQDVPVAVSALGQQQIEDLAITTVQDLSALVPGFNAGDAQSPAPQGTISLRGISTGATATSADQAVSINIDGVAIEHADALRTGQIDLQQIEVLKGPQALFFGKNATGGVVAIRTADPTKDFYYRVRGAYEFNANEKVLEGVLSGPLSDTLGARAVVQVSAMDGYIKNIATSPVASRTAPNEESIFGRLTLKWDPADNFGARLKISHFERESDQSTTAEKISCGNPAADTGDCTADFVTALADPVNGAKPFSKNDSTLVSLDLRYDISDVLTVNSITGYSEFNRNEFGQIVPRDIGAIPLPDPTTPSGLVEGPGGVPILFPNEIVVRRDNSVKSFSQELRLTSDTGGAFNFMVGAFYDEKTIQAATSQLTFLGGAVAIPDFVPKVDSNSVSVFAQGIWDIWDTVELAGGLRYIEESRKFSGVYNIPGVGAVPAIPAIDKLESNEILPEITLTWRPNSNLTIYGGYKEAFKSGSFNDASTTLIGLTQAPGAFDISFAPESAKGFEGGIKATLLDGSMIFNTAVYRYEYTNLQLSTFNPVSVATQTINAGAATVEGVEFDVMFRPKGIDGLTLNAALAYNNAEYHDFIGDCHQVELANLTCALDVNNDGVPESRQYAGEPLNLAPEFAGSLGFLYDTPIGERGLGLRFGVNLVYSDKYETDERNNPLGTQDAYTTLNANVSLYNDQSGWSIDLIGRNLTDKAIVTRSANQPFTGIPSNFATSTPGVPADQMAGVLRGRQVMVQLKFEH